MGTEAERGIIRVGVVSEVSDSQKLHAYPEAQRMASSILTNNNYPSLSTLRETVASQFNQLHALGPKRFTFEHALNPTSTRVKLLAEEDQEAYARVLEDYLPYSTVFDETNQTYCYSLTIPFGRKIEEDTPSPSSRTVTIFASPVAGESRYRAMQMVQKRDEENQWKTTVLEFIPRY